MLSWPQLVPAPPLLYSFGLCEFSPFLVSFLKSLTISFRKICQIPLRKQSGFLWGSLVHQNRATYAWITLTLIKKSSSSFPQMFHDTWRPRSIQRRCCYPTAPAEHSTQFQSKYTLRRPLKDNGPIFTRHYYKHPFMLTSMQYISSSRFPQGNHRNPN